MIRRNTNQKQIVYETINAKGHITSEELILEIMGNHNDISLASIYRNLNRISNENVTDCDIVFYGVCHNCLKNRKGDKENEEVRM